MRVRIDFEKIKKRIWANIVLFCRTKTWYVKIYKCYWHYRFSPARVNGEVGFLNYYTAIPNRGAGIGHQMANWIAGYWFARQFDLQFAHTPFSSEKWEEFLGFGANEMKVEELQEIGYKKVNLPLFDEYDIKEFSLVKKIVDSYGHQRVIFVAEQDQFYKDQFEIMDELKTKFHNSPARKNDQLMYSDAYFNIAIHVRRGDIVIGNADKNTNLSMRWQDNSYFENVLSNVIKSINYKKPNAIYLFSQGERSEFIEFEKFDNMHFCLDMNAQDSFLHMVNADVLITSKSSFSYKPALLSNGVKISPRHFWHSYPDAEDWIMVDEYGNFDTTLLNRQ